MPALKNRVGSTLLPATLILYNPLEVPARMPVLQCRKEVTSLNLLNGYVMRCFPGSIKAIFPP